MSRLRKLSEIGPIVVLDCLCAVYELARANRKFRKLPAGKLVDHVRLPPGGHTEASDDQVTARIIKRVAFAIPAIALRLPWRADCMVQAMAAQTWLARYKIPSTMRIGVRKGPLAGPGANGPSANGMGSSGPGPSGFAAHAWLTVGNVVVTGGDVSGYVAIEVNSPDRNLARSDDDPDSTRTH